jgi:TetR/AcrR family transcriptional repressor of nem operon
LLGEAFEYASGQTLDFLSDALESVPSEERLKAVIDAYLSPGHAARPGGGCPVAALGPELARSPEARQRLSRAVKKTYSARWHA